MSKYFTIRHPLPVSVAGQSHVFHVRELGYIEFDELKSKILAVVNGQDQERRGTALMQAVVVACVEEEDGSASYTADEWRTEVKEVVLIVGKAALKAQGIDLDKAENQEQMTEEQAAGNA